ncbi:uncharacterized protein LOC109861156 isoform X2 [Pseudomyrmex gracilis]|uniref:uncharacterized protein LOC109861156 isoform X2 n=1 Tax=Pseudomyrmex gracilis TaxID=219809 RepID=UPI000995B468|nr:uncharacterized protein LOC109861156 isoform X2 [Pseudomyrmex gracilis]
MWKEKSFSIFSMINNFFYKKNVLYNSIFEEAIKLYSITKNTSRDTFNEQSILDILWENVRVVPAIHKNIRLETINIKNVITSWITQHGYPVVQVTRNNDAQSLTIKVIDCIAVNQKELCEHKWWIPIIYVTISKNKSITHHYSYLDQERKDIVVLNIEEDDFIVITDQNESAKIKDRALEILNKFFEDTSHINVSENSIDTQLYHETLKWTCILNSSKCNKHLTDILEWHLQSPAQNKLLVSWQKWIYCQGVTLGIINDSMLFLTIQDIYLLQEKQNHFFHLLSCGHNYRLAVRYAQEHTLGKKSDFVSILFHIVARHVKRFSFLDAILSQIQNKFLRPVGLLAVVNFSINHIYSDEDSEMITKTVRVMVTNLINRYNLETPTFIHDIIMKKIMKRRTFINIRKLLIWDIPYLLHY